MIFNIKYLSFHKDLTFEQNSTYLVVSKSKTWKSHGVMIKRKIKNVTISELVFVLNKINFAAFCSGTISENNIMHVELGPPYLRPM